MHQGFGHPIAEIRSQSNFRKVCAQSFPFVGPLKYGFSILKSFPSGTMTPADFSDIPTRGFRAYPPASRFSPSYVHRTYGFTDVKLHSFIQVMTSSFCGHPPVPVHSLQCPPDIPSPCLKEAVVYLPHLPNRKPNFWALPGCATLPFRPTL